MKSDDKTRKQPFKEIELLKAKIAELEKSETNRKQAEEALRESEAMYSALFETAKDAVFLSDETGKLVDVNQMACESLGYSKEELLKLSNKEIDADPRGYEAFLKVRNGAKERITFEVNQRRKDGTLLPVEITGNFFTSGGQRISLAIARDITERKQAENKVKHLNLVLRAIRNVNQLIVKENNRERFLKGICNNLIETRGYYSAWIVLLNESGKLERYAEAGIGKAFLPMVEILNKGELIVCGQKALKQQEVVIIKDPASTCPVCPLVKKHSGRRVMTIRLEYNGKVYGLMSVSIPTHITVDKEEQSLLKEIAGDVAFGIHNIELDKKRKRAEEELKDSEEHLKVLFDYAPDAYYTHDSKGNFVDGNKAAEKVSGYKKEELIGKSFLKLKLLSISDIPKAAKLLVKSVMGLPTGPDEFVLNRKDGSKVIVEILSCLVKIKGRVLTLGLARDITERKQAEENLKNIKDELEMIMDSVPAIIFYKDTEGRIIRANKALADSLKVPVKDIVGKTTEELFPKEQAEAMRKYDKEVIAFEKPKRNIIEAYDTPEGVRWAITDKMPYKDKKGKVTGVINLSKDITVQKKAEQKLKKTMDAAIDTMSNIIEAKDPYTAGHQHRVSQLATRMAQELGLSPDKIEGIRIASLIHDIGKIGLPTEILSKPTKLIDIEFSLIKGHSQIGYDILKSIDFPYPIAQIVLQHHERLNGSGYPNNSKGDEILMEAKILGVADVVEAMSSHRPYRPALGIDVALEEISKNRGKLYDPEGVDVCINLFKEKGFKFK